MSLNEISRAELLALPTRNWQSSSNYDSIMLLHSRRKHDSGWGIIYVIGVNKGKPVEIAAAPDDIEWVSPAPYVCAGRPYGQMRMDCCFRSGAMHAWQYDHKFFVGSALSSTRIDIKPVEAGHTDQSGKSAGNFSN